MSEGVEDSSAGLVAPPASTSPTVSGAAPEEETAADAAGGNDTVERGAPLGLAGLAGTCCICMQVDQVRGCLRSEKICILPILACLLSLALCTAGLKWVFVDKIFEYEPPTHLDPKRIGQDPVIAADPTLGLPKLFPDSSTLFTPTTGHGETSSKNEPTEGPFGPLPPQVTHYNPTSALTLRTNAPAWPGPPTTTRSIRKGTPTSYPEPTLGSNDIYIPKFSATSTTAPVRTSSHEKQCSEKHKDYCVNGGTCFTIEIAPDVHRQLCRCPNEFTGDRCQNYVMASFYKHLGIEFMEAEELYQKRVLTITGICIALLVVGIMCVVAYCKTKKQRKKLHDRLRQSLRNERNAMAAMANGPQISSPPNESLQLVRQYESKNAILAEHTIEKETETSFSTTPCTSSTQSSTAATQTSTKSWSNGRSEIISHSHSVLVTSSESSKHVTPSSRRGRLNATGCVRELGAQLKNARDTPDSYKDSPYSERYVSAMTTPTRMSPVELLSPESPPSEMSPPLSSLAMSVPSIAVSPQGEEERPLLFTTPPRLRDKQRQDQTTTISDQYQRNSAHYNHAHEVHSPPPSPQRIVEDDDYETTQEYEAAAPQPSKKLANGGSKAKRTKVNGHTAHKLESNGESSSESSSSECETEDERVGEDTPFLSIQNPLAANLESAAAAAVAVSAASTSACRPTESSRTNPALRLSTKEDLQARLSSVIANQDPIAV